MRLPLGFSGAFFAIGLLTTASAHADAISPDSFTLSAYGGVADLGSQLAFNVGDQPPYGYATTDVATTAGVSYILSFDYETSGGYAQSITASATDFATSTLLGSDFVTSSVIGSPESFQFAFTAIGADTTLEFADYGGNFTYSEDGGVSNINLVPEPASLSLMGAGLFGLGWLRRRKTI